MSIIEIAEAECRKAGCGRVDAIRVRVGRASGVLAEALLSAFEIVRIDSPLASTAALTVEDIPLGGTCGECGKHFTAEDMFVIDCPHCGSRALTITRGRELDIIELEVT